MMHMWCAQECLDWQYFGPESDNSHSTVWGGGEEYQLIIVSATFSRGMHSSLAVVNVVPK